MKFIGAHSSILNGLVNAAEEIHKIGGNVIQIYLGDSNDELDFTASKKEIEQFKSYITENNMLIFVHATYLHNIASEFDKNKPTFIQLVNEMKIAEKIGAEGFIVHTGNRNKLIIDEAYNNMYMTILYLINLTKQEDFKIYIETNSGQGTGLCYKINDLAYFYRKLTRNAKIGAKVKICIDTCHIYQAGYDISNKSKVKLFIEELDELIGIHNVQLIHLNDSVNSIGMRVDRHESIGKGKIGLVGLYEFFKYFYDREVPIILETPGVSYIKEIKMLSK